MDPKFRNNLKILIELLKDDVDILINILDQMGILNEEAEGLDTLIIPLTSSSIEEEISENFKEWVQYKLDSSLKEEDYETAVKIRDYFKRLYIEKK